MLWDRIFVVVGMSFECDIDKFLLSALHRAEDEMPIGESVWVVVNRNKDALDIACTRIEEALPRATVKKVCSDFSGWLKAGMNELQECGAITFGAVRGRTEIPD